MVDTPTTLTEQRNPNFELRSLHVLRILLVVLLAILVLIGPGLSDLVERFWLPFVGIAGALVANSTGIGGGVVFVPAFDKIGIPTDEIVGTSLLIQSFGMTMGALTFLARRPRDNTSDIGTYATLILLCLIPSLAGAVLATWGDFRPDLHLKTIYKAISLLLVALIVVSSLMPRKGDGQFRPVSDGIMLAILGFIGGLFVGWISIGVGELVGVYLLIRGYRVSDAVGIAVIVTALTVLGVQAVHFPGLPADVSTGLLVVVGALPGAFLAPYLLDFVGQTRMKWFCAVWIVLSVAVT